MKIALVTGATGFLGSALAEHLLENGHQVVGIGRRHKGFLSDATLSNVRFTFLHMDLTKDCSTALSNYPIDVIFHLAAKQPNADARFEDFYMGNTEITRNVIKYAKQAGISQLVCTSTLSVFGKDPGVSVLTEKNIPIPTSYYGITKYIAERMIEIDLSQSRVQGTVVRFPSLYGQNHLGGMIHTYYQLAKEGKDIEVYGRGETIRDALYVDSAVDILCRVAEKKETLSPFEMFFVGSANSLPMAKIAEHVRDCLHSSSKIVLIDKPSSPAWDLRIDTGEAKRRLGFNPLTLEDGIKKYIEDILQPRNYSFQTSSPMI